MRITHTHTHACGLKPLAKPDVTRERNRASCCAADGPGLTPGVVAVNAATAACAAAVCDHPGKVGDAAAEVMPEV
jgi:hypothetical protein